MGCINDDVKPVYIVYTCKNVYLNSVLTRFTLTNTYYLYKIIWPSHRMVRTLYPKTFLCATIAEQNTANIDWLTGLRLPFLSRGMQSKGVCTYDSSFKTQTNIHLMCRCYKIQKRWRTLVGRQGEGVMNENGERLRGAEDWAGTFSEWRKSRYHFTRQLTTNHSKAPSWTRGFDK